MLQNPHIDRQKGALTGKRRRVMRLRRDREEIDSEEWVFEVANTS
jgi:hypothetical protein